MLWGWVLGLLLVFLGSALATAQMRALCLRRNWVVHPSDDRWHKKPTAVHGGIGFVPVFFLGACFLFLAKIAHQPGVWEFSSLGFKNEVGLAGALLVGSLLMFLVGLVDDIRRCSPSTKLLFQLIGASLVISAGGRFEMTGIPILDILLTYFWFVGITNAFNLLDNMDGLSVGIAIISAAAISLLSLSGGGISWESNFGGLLAPLFCAALLGFWIFNRNPARIFMGDSGSLFVGFFLAGLALPSALNGSLGTAATGAPVHQALLLLIPVAILVIPIWDTSLVTFTRLWRAQKATQGGKDHTSHRLVALGLSESNAVFLLYLLSALGCLTAVLMQRDPAASLIYFGMLASFLSLAGVYLGRVKIQVRESLKVTPRWVKLTSNLLNRWHGAEVLLDVVLVALCYHGAFLLRFEGDLTESAHRMVLDSLPTVIISCLLAFAVVRIYQRQWKLPSVVDLFSLTSAALLGTVFSLASLALVTRFEGGLSRSVYAIFGVLLLLSLVGSRFSFRLLEMIFLQWELKTGADERKPVLIYGAGKAGRILFEETLLNPQWSPFVVVGFVDDNRNLVGRKLCGFPVKSRNDWVKVFWARVPEIWVSSRFIADSVAFQLANRLEKNVVVKRLSMSMKPVFQLPNVEVKHGETHLRLLERA